MGARLPKLGGLRGVLLFLGIALAPLFSIANAAILPISEFSGLNTEASPATLQGGQTPDSENVVTDEFGGLQPRQGFTLCHTSSSTAQWVFPHSGGTIYQIIQSGNVLKADTGGCTFSVTISTVASGINTAAAVLGDRFYFTNTTDGLRYWDTSTVTVASATIAATQLVAHKARLWAAGIAASPRTVFASAFGDGTNWNLATDPVVTDPAQFVIGGASGFPLTTLYTSHQDAVVWMASRSFGAISGNSRADFTVRTYSDNVGTAYPDSVQNCDGLLRFLGPARTVYEWNGAELVNIGSVIKTYLGQIGQGDANTRAYTITTQADWQTGTIGLGLSATTSPGEMVLDYTLIDDFTDGDYTASPVWTEGYNTGTASVSISGGKVKVTNGSGTGEARWLITPNLNTSNTGIWKASFSDFGAGANATIGLSTRAAGSELDYRQKAQYQAFVGPNGLSWQAAVYLLDNSGTETLISSSTISTPASSFVLSLSRNSSGFFSFAMDDVVVASGTETTYTSFATVFVAAGAGDDAAGSTYFDDVYYKVYSSTYVSTSFALGSISTFGQFSAVSTLNGGTLSYAIYTDSDTTKTITSGAPVAGTFLSSQTITSGSIPTISTAAYAFFSESFTITSQTQTPTTDLLSLAWNEGNTTKTPSAWFRQRYWLGVSYNSATNNRVLVFDKNRQWQRYSGISAASLAIYNGGLFFGNSDGVYQYETGYTDAGSDIASYYRTPTLSPAGPNLSAVFNDVQLTTDESEESLVTTFQVNGASTDYSLSSKAMNDYDGIQNFRLSFPFSQIQQGRNISLEFAVTGGSFWRILGATLDFVPDIVPE